MIIKKTNGSTLIELLVVIAIIALLLAILMPALGIAKQKAKALVCRMNEKSLQLATFLYAQDNADKMVRQRSSGGSSGGYGNLWIEAIAGYCEDVDEIRYCPNTKPKEGNGRTPGDAKTSWQWSGYIDSSGTTRTARGSYAINAWFYSYTDSYNPIPDFQEMRYKRITDARSPSSTPFFIDSNWVDAWPVDDEVCGDGLNLDGLASSIIGIGKFRNIEKLLMNRHGKVTNVSFVDGHQEAVDLDMVWTLKWHAKFISKGKMTRQPSGDPVYRK